LPERARPQLNGCGRFPFDPSPEQEKARSKSGALFSLQAC
jgi:hypothetical protein